MLTNEITIDDPEAFTKTWGTLHRFALDEEWRPQEETCSDSSMEGTFSAEELGGERR